MKILVLVFKLLLDPEYLKKFGEGISKVLEKCSYSTFFHMLPAEGKRPELKNKPLSYTLNYLRYY